MSLHLIARDGLTDWLGRRGIATRATSRSVAVPIRMSISSMRVLETSLALSAIATAMLLGLGR